MKRELTIRELAPYFPYGLKVKGVKNDIFGIKDCIYSLSSIAIGINGNTIMKARVKSELFGTYSIVEYEIRKGSELLLKPILRPLSDFTKTIIHNKEEFVPNTKIENLFDIEDLDMYLNYLVKREDDGNVFISRQKQYSIIQQLLEWHFDIFSLIDSNLALDINQHK